MNATDRSEQLAAQTTVEDSPTATGGVQIKGVAIGEGDVTKGQSKERTRWPGDVLEAAAETLRGEKTNLVRGPGGATAHWPMSEQVPAEDLVGSVTFDYEDGVGLTFDGEVVDETLARQIDLGLLEVSPDLYRTTGPAGPDGVQDVEEILALPRLTLVEQAAGPSAAVEVAGGSPEALAEYLAKPPEEDRSEEEVEQLAASTLTLNDRYDMHRRDLTAREYLAEHYGIDASAFGDGRELLATVREARQ